MKNILLLKKNILPNVMIKRKLQMHSFEVPVERSGLARAPAFYHCTGCLSGDHERKWPEENRQLEWQSNLKTRKAESEKKEKDILSYREQEWLHSIRKINRKTDTRDKGHHIIIKGSIPQEDATINKYVLREGTR